MSESKQGIMNTMSLPINEDYKAVSIAVGQLLSEGWKWGGLSKPENSGGMTYIHLDRTFEYDPTPQGLVENKSNHQGK